MAKKPNPKKMKAAAMAKGKKKGKKKSMTWQWRLLSIMVLISSVVVLPTTIMLLLGMIPSMVAFFVDRTKKKTAGITVGCLNFAGNIPFIVKLWGTGHDLANCMQLLSNPVTIIVMWAAAFVGWVLHDYIPPLFATGVKAKGDRRLRDIRLEQKALVDEWGKEVAGEYAYVPPSKGGNAAKEKKDEFGL